MLTVCCRLLLDTPALAAGAAGNVPVDTGPVNSVADTGSSGFGTVCSRVISAALESEFSPTETMITFK